MMSVSSGSVWNAISNCWRKPVPVLGDGTFQVTPNLWKQQYSLQLVLQEFTIPAVFSSFLAKRKHCTLDCFALLWIWFRGSWARRGCLISRAGMISAHRELMPDGVSAGCFFHLSNFVGWRQRYTEDAAFRRRVVALSTLAYLPVDFVSRAFDLLQREFPLEERSITNRPTSTHSNEIPSRPIFPPAFWNVSSRQYMGLPSTTNALERFHLNQQHCLHHASHPSVPIFVHDLHRQIALGDLRLAQVRAGDRRSPSTLLTRKMEKFASILVS